MRFAYSIPIVALAACASHPQPSGPPGDVTAILSLDGKSSNTTLAVSDVDGVRTVGDGASGTVTFRITPPAIVTAIDGAEPKTWSFTGVEPGDALCFACATPPEVHTAIAVPPRADAATYSFGNGDEMIFNSPTPQVDLFTEHAGPHDVLVLANDAGGAHVAWTAATRQILDGGTVTLPDDWHPLDTMTAIYDDAPAMPAELQINYGEMSDGVHSPTYASVPTVAALDGGHAEITVPRAHFGSTMAVSSTLFASNYDQINSVRVIAPTAAIAHVSLAHTLLPWVTDVAYDPDTRTVSWRLTGGAADDDGDAVRVLLDWQTPDVTISEQWEVYAPPGATSVTFPVLPGGDPAGTVRGATVELDDYDGVGSYDELRSSTGTYPAARGRASIGSNIDFGAAAAARRAHR